MPMRSFLLKEQSIFLSTNPENELPERYIINSVIGEEENVICYEATRIRGGIAETGTLKKIPETYISNYRHLNLRHCEILYGDFAGETAIFIWLPEIFGQTFDKYLTYVRENLQSDADKFLHEILSLVISLIEGINAIHNTGFAHLDIKPANFLVPYDSARKLIPESVPLLEGSAPNIPIEKIDTRADIYSIGALLFNALVINKNLPADAYNNNLYKSIDQLIRHSKLITTSESNSDVELISGIANILKKCLTLNKETRYANCEELLADLKKIEMRIRQYSANPDSTVEESGIRDSAIVIEKLLYEHPLYETAAVNQQINILVVGAGTFGQKFIDICLQVGQMLDCHLNITAISENSQADSQRYLQFRPAITKFVNVNENGDKPYGDINFRALLKDKPDLAFSTSDFKKNQQIISEISAECTYDYIFIALGEDNLNRTVAQIFLEIAREKFKTPCPIAYVSESSDVPQIPSAYPVFVNEKITPANIDPQLEQMALNTHIAWENSLNMDIEKTKQDFRNSKYYYSSSLSFALSIKYKLHSLGIKLGDNYFEAANLFFERVLKDKSKDFERMINLEHRRWVLSKVTDGWSAPLDENGNLNLEKCVNDGRVDEINLTHPCILFSTESSPLKNYTHADWNNPNIDPALDDFNSTKIFLKPRSPNFQRIFKKKSMRV